MKTTLVTASTAEALTLDEIKRHLRLPEGETAEDTYLSALRNAAQEIAEMHTNRKLTRQTQRLILDSFPSGDSFDLPYPPLQSVSSSGIVYTNSTGDSTTFSSTAWGTDTVSEPGRVVLEYDADWPTDTLNNNNPIAVDFVCGYSSPSSIPAGIKHAMLLLVSHWYETREPAVVSNLAAYNVDSLPPAVGALLNPYRVYRFY